MEKETVAPSGFSLVWRRRNQLLAGYFAGCQNVKIVPFDVVTSYFNVISNSRRKPLTVITFRKGLEMFRFPVVKSSFRFPNVKIITVPATSFINDFG